MSSLVLPESTTTSAKTPPASPPQTPTIASTPAVGNSNCKENDGDTLNVVDELDKVDKKSLNDISAEVCLFFL